MTELTPLARKLRDARAAGGSHVKVWNNVAKVAEAELASVAESATVRPVRLPTVEECHQAMADRYALDDGWDWCASVVLDLAARLNPTWVPVPADATIPAGTLVRVEYQEYAHRAQEWTAKEDRTPAMWQSGVVYLVPSGTALEFPLDPRIESAARAIYTANQQGGGDQCWDTTSAAIRDIYVELAKAAAEALGVTM